jgi:hypothetical protein
MQLLRDHLPLFTAAVGFALPLLLSFVQRERWQTRTKALVTFAAALVAAAVSTWAAGQLDATAYVRSALTILIAALATYEGFYKPTGIAGAIAAKLQPGAGQTASQHVVQLEQSLEPIFEVLRDHAKAIDELLAVKPPAKKPTSARKTATKKTGGPKA